ncbi:4Fe-4S binding protein [Kutzneria chonburiensis]|uniref:4Fe-4S binding protein n=1 Tax=Kutzneria chonburiensis TaxID=1483604 RepID=A0ABV6MWC1_9PSEU|nr:4Fe-4S binding protein [Kutzneria chonburiensis]
MTDQNPGGDFAAAPDRSAADGGAPGGGAEALPPRTRGVIALLEANCTVCMICARECPDWCIHIDSHTETVQQEGAARPRQQNVLDRFAIDYGQCLYCGICVEVCPFDALHWAPEHDYPGTGEHAVAELVHERADLGKWIEQVPPPPPLDAAAEAAPEAAAGRPGRGAPGTATRPGALSGRTRRPGG